MISSACLPVIRTCTNCVLFCCWWWWWFNFCVKLSLSFCPRDYMLLLFNNYKNRIKFISFLKYICVLILCHIVQVTGVAGRHSHSTFLNNSFPSHLRYAARTRFATLSLEVLLLLFWLEYMLHNSTRARCVCQSYSCHTLTRILEHLLIRLVNHQFFVIRTQYWRFWVLHIYEPSH